MLYILIVVSLPQGGNPLVTPVDNAILERMSRGADALQKKHGMPVKKVHFKKAFFAMQMWDACLKRDDGRSVADLLSEASGRPVNVWIELLKSVVRMSSFSFSILFVSLIQLSVGVPKNSPDYRKLLGIAEVLKQEFISTLGSDGILICPTMPQEAPKHNTAPLRGLDVSFCGLANILGLPSTQVPIGLNSNNMPIGLQVIAGPDNDRLCLAVAEELEKEFGGWCHPWRANN